MKAVNRRLEHFRERVTNPIRPEQGRKPIRSKKKSRSSGVQSSNGPIRLSSLQDLA